MRFFNPREAEYLKIEIDSLRKIVQDYHSGKAIGSYGLAQAKQITELEAQVEMLNRETAELKQQVGNFEVETQKLAASNEELSKQVVELRARYTTLHEGLVRLVE